MKILVLFWYFPAPKGVWKKCWVTVRIPISPPPLYTGRAGITWKARGAFRTRSQSAPQTTLIRRPESACLRWRRTSGAGQQLRSSRAQVRFLQYVRRYFLVSSNFILHSSLQAFRNQGQITGIFYVPEKPWNHRLLTFNPSDNYHMVLSHNKVIT